MSSIRLFILSSLAKLGPTHGHRLRTEAEKRRVHLWTDISTGAVYGAINRLAAEGLIRDHRREIEGNRPPRQLYEITESGRTALAELQRDASENIWFRYDPFDLAMTSIDRNEIAEFSAVVSSRLVKLKSMAAEREAVITEALRCIDVIDEWALRHSSYRLAAEIKYFEDLLAWMIEKNERSQKIQPQT